MTVITRRRALAVGTVAVATAAGAAAGRLRPRKIPRPAAKPPAPRPLDDAVNREQNLLAGIEAALAADATQAAVLTPIRADHQAHLDALRAEREPYAGPSPSPTGPTTSSAPVPVPTRAELVAAERAAVTAGQAATAAAPAGFAALLASIAACEAGHAELLA